MFLWACQAEAPAPKTSSTQDLLAQVEAIEADEAALLFQQAKVAAEQDKVKEAKSLIQQALGRGAGSNGMASAEAEIGKAEARIKERKRKAEQARISIETHSSNNPSDSTVISPSRASGLKQIDGVKTGTMSEDTYNAYCMDGSVTNVTVSYTFSKSDPVICASNSYKASKCKNSSDWNIENAGRYGCER